jgi:hypothetical protein
MNIITLKNNYVGFPYVARDPNIHPETLALMTSDEDPEVRCYVAINPNTPQYVKDYLTARNFMENYGS